MAADLRTLSVRVEAVEAIRAAKQTGAALDEMGAKGERAANRLAASTSPLTQAVKQQASAYQGATIDLRAAEAAYDKMMGVTSGVTDATRKMTLVQMEAIAMNEKLGQTVAASSTMAGAHIGRLREGFASLVAQMTGLPPIVTRIGSTLGVMVAGMGEVVIAMAAIGAVVWVWNKLTEGAKAYQKSVDDLVESLVKQRKAAFDATASGLELIKIRAEMEQQAAYNTPTGWKRVLLNPNPGDERARQLAADAAVAQARDNETAFYTKQLEEQAKAKEKADAKILASEKQRVAAAKRAEAERLAIQNKGIAEREKANKESNDRIAEYNKHVAEIMDTGSYAKQREKDFDDATKDAIKNIDHVGDALAKTIGKETNSPIKHMLEEVQKDFTNFFTNVFTKGIKSFGDLFGEIKNMFLRLVAEMASAKLMQKLGVGALASLFPVLASGQSGVGGGMSPQQVASELFGQSRLGHGLQVAGAGVGGALIGYGLGSSTGSAAIGALGGAASGAAMGAQFGPVGMAVGALAGLAGGILGAGAAAKRAAKEMATLQAAVLATMEGLRAQVSGDQLGQALAKNKADTAALLKQIDDAFKGKANDAERNRQRAEAIALEGKLADKLREEYGEKQKQLEQDLQVRLLRAQLNGQAADDMAFSLAQERELAEARKNGASQAAIATLVEAQKAEAEQRSLDIAREHKRAIEDLNVRLAIANGLTQDQVDDLQFAISQQREYEDAVRSGRDAAYLATLQQVQLAEAHKRSADKIRQTISDLEKTIASLTGFRNQLLLGSLSSLSPTLQLEEARRQYEEVLGKVRGGSQDAAGNLPGAAQTLLDLSKSVNASGFASDFAKVLQDTNEAISQFEAAKSIQQQMLDALVGIEGATTEAKDANPSILEELRAANAAAQEQIKQLAAQNEALTAQIAVMADGFNKMVLGQGNIGSKIDETNDRLRRVQEIQ